MAKILLTGATGFIGRHIYRSLLVSTHKVYPTCGRLVNLLSDTEVDLLLAKVKPSCLIANAWMAVPKIFWDHPSNDQWSRSTQYLIKQFYIAGGQRCIFVSSAAAKDHLDTPYGRCKKEVEYFLSNYPNHEIVPVGYPRGNGEAAKIGQHIADLVGDMPKIIYGPTPITKEIFMRDGHNDGADL